MTDELYSCFSIIVDPTNLNDGLHYYELYGIDYKAPWRGPIFRIPITVTKPMAVTDRYPLVPFSNMLFLPGALLKMFPEISVHLNNFSQCFCNFCLVYIL